MMEGIPCGAHFAHKSQKAVSCPGKSRTRGTHLSCKDFACRFGGISGMLGRNGEDPMPTEADTCRTFIVPNLHASGWEDDFITEQMVLTPGRIVPIGNRHTRRDGLRPDYVLFIRQNIPIAVVEAKAEYKSPAAGLQQAVQYAEMMGLKFAYSSNGTGIVEHDFITGVERNLDAFPSPDELWGRLKGTFKFESEKEESDSLSAYWQEVGGKSPRYYQQVAINKAVNAVLDRAFKGEL